MLRSAAIDESWRSFFLLVPQVVEDRAEMDQIMSQERISERNVEQSVDVPMLEIFSSCHRSAVHIFQRRRNEPLMKINRRVFACRRERDELSVFVRIDCGLCAR